MFNTLVESIQLTLGESGGGKPWTGRQRVTGPTQKQTTILTHMHIWQFKDTDQPNTTSVLQNQIIWAYNHLNMAPIIK